MMTAPELLSMNATILCDALTIASLELFPANDFRPSADDKKTLISLMGLTNPMILQVPLRTSILIWGSLLLNQGGKDRERVFLENFQENLLDKPEDSITTIFSHGLFTSIGRPLIPPLMWS